MVSAEVWILDEDMNQDRQEFVEGLKELPRQAELLVLNDSQYVVQTVAHQVDRDELDEAREHDVTIWVLPYEIHEQKIRQARGKLP